MTEAALPTDHEIEAAARVLFEAGKHHGWWPSFEKTYEEMAAADPIGKSEFDGLVERILMAAAKARSLLPPSSS